MKHKAPGPMHPSGLGFLAEVKIEDEASGE